MKEKRRRRKKWGRERMRGLWTEREPDRSVEASRGERWGKKEEGK